MDISWAEAMEVSSSCKIIAAIWWCYQIIAWWKLLLLPWCKILIQMYGSYRNLYSYDIGFLMVLQSKN